jgi:hypothetical protein
VDQCLTKGDQACATKQVSQENGFHTARSRDVKRFADGGRDFFGGGHHASLPRGLPKSTSSCEFPRVILLTSFVGAHFPRRIGSMPMRSDRSGVSATSSEQESAAGKTEAGIRTATLLLRFLTLAVMVAHLLVSTVYTHFPFNPSNP